MAKNGKLPVVTNNGKSGSGNNAQLPNDCGGSGRIQQPPPKRKQGCCDRVEFYLRHLGRGTTWLSIFLGQLLSCLLCASAVISVYLVDVYQIRVPNAQNFLFYIVLATVFTTALACRPAERNLFPVLKTRGWKYLLVAICDAESNYLILKAYQFTTLTSGQLLDCFAIPTVLSFSWLVLRIRFKVPHIFGVSISLLGLCCLVWADVEDGRPLGPGKDRFLGDMICLAGSFLRGISNTAQEFVVKTFDIVEFLGMVGLFGSFVCGLQCLLFEYGAISASMEMLQGEPPLNTQTALIIAFATCQVLFYVIAGNVMKLSGATAFNLSLLTSDFYSLIVGIFLFQVKFHALYFLSFVLVMTGVIMFAIKPTLISSDVYPSASLTRDQTHSTTLDLELMASTPLSPDGNGTHLPFCSSANNSSHSRGGQCHSLSRSHSQTEQNGEISLGGSGSLLVRETTGKMNLLSGSGGAGANGEPPEMAEASLLSNEGCDVVLQATTVVSPASATGNNGNSCCRQGQATTKNNINSPVGNGKNCTVLLEDKVC